MKSMFLTLENVTVRWEQTSEQRNPSRFALWPLNRPLPSKPVLDNVSLNVDEGDFLVVLGPSGSGKTTLLKTLAGLIQPESGRILYRSSDIRRVAPHQRELAFVLQNGGWYDHLTVEENLNLDGASERERSSVLDRLGLAELRRRMPSQLSGGQTQRLAIARALLRKHDLILFDEPLSQLDYYARESLRAVVRQLHQDGKTVIYVTHDQHDAMMMATKIAVIHDGRIQQCDSPEAIYRQPNHRVVAEALGQPPMQFFAIESTKFFSELFRNRFGTSLDPATVELGIRPEAWQLVGLPNESGPRDSLRCLADFVEQRTLGAYRLQTWSVEGDSDVSCRILRLSGMHELPIPPTNQTYLEVADSDVFFFDKRSGRRH